MDLGIQDVISKLKIENLVFDGGGVRGLAFVGALEVFERYNLASNLRRVAGTSIGSLAALVVSLGYNVDEFKEILLKLNISNLQDPDLFALPRLFGQYGICEGDKLLDFAKELVVRKTGNPNFTFRMLRATKKYHLENFGSSKFLDLYVVAANLATSRSEIFSADSAYLDMPIALATRISMSIPLFYKAIEIPVGAYGPGTGGTFIDGAALRIYPIDIFDKIKYVEPSANSIYKNLPIVNFKTLGIKVDTNDEIRDYFNFPRISTVEGFFDYCCKLGKLVVKQQRDLHARNFYHDSCRTVYCDVGNLSSVDFGISEIRKQILHQQGKLAAMLFIQEQGKKLLRYQRAMPALVFKSINRTNNHCNYRPAKEYLDENKQDIKPVNKEKSFLNYGLTF